MIKFKIEIIERNEIMLTIFLRFKEEQVYVSFFCMPKDLVVIFVFPTVT